MISIAPGCVFEDEATSQSGFLALFSGLGAGESLEIEVFGIGTQEANEILAYEVRSKVD